MKIYFLFVFFGSLIEKIIANSLKDNDNNYWEDNIWLLVLLIIFSVGLIILIVFISIKIYRNSRKKTSQNKVINLVDTERASQQYISEYDKNGKNNKKIKYKERPMKEEGND